MTEVLHKNGLNLHRIFRRISLVAFRADQDFDFYDGSYPPMISKATGYECRNES
jgi:hypothetical protein